MKMVSGKLCAGEWLRLLCFSFLLSLMLLVGAAAQETTTITGTVSSVKGGPIADAKVIITDRASAQTSVVRTDANGNFTSAPLTPSDFVLRVEAPSFVTVTLPVTARAGAPTQEDIQLTPEPLLGAVDVTNIANLPFNANNFLENASFEPGVQVFDAASLDPAGTALQSLSTNGATGRVHPQIAVDGLTVSNRMSGSITQNIPLTAIQEFHYGGVLGPISDQMHSPGAVDFITHSGGNELHGNLFGAYRNGDVLSASLPGGHNRDWGRQQYGGNLNGAIIPDKLFFFADVQRNKLDLANPVLLAGPFAALAPSGVIVREPFREFETNDRIDYRWSDTTRLFYRFTYDRNSDVSPLAQGQGLQPFLSKTNTPSNAVGVDFTSGSFVNSLRFEYLKFKNVITPPGTGTGVLNPLPVTVNIGGGATTQCTDGSLYCAGPSFESQQTRQSDFQIRYDGSRVWNNHVFRVGANFNRFHGGLFDSRYQFAPVLSDQGSVALPAGIFGSTGDPSNPLNYPVQWAFLGNGQPFSSENSAFGFPGGGFTDNQIELYGGDTWKITPAVTLTYGLHWMRESGLTDSDLAAIPALSAWGTGLGSKVRQPNLNFAPQLGVAWNTSPSGKTVIRAGAGLFYDNSLFQNTALDRPLRLSQGTFNATPAACVSGAPGQIQWPNAGAVGSAIAGGAGIVNPNGTVSPTWCGESIGTAGSQAIALQTAYQMATAAAAGVNASYIGNPGAYAGPYVNGLSLLAPDYQTPRTFQMDVGLQHELWPGLTFTADYVREVTTRTLLGVDVNQGGAADTFNVANAVADRDAAQSANGCLTGTNQVSCMVGKLGPAGALAAYGAAGIGGPAQVTGGAPCPICAFPGIHPNLGVNVMNFPVGRSVYSGELVTLKQQVTRFSRGVQRASFEFSYAHSRYVSQSDSEELTPVATDYANPDHYTGPGALDRVHQISIGAHFDLQKSFQLSFVSHLFSPLPQTLRFQQNSGGAEVLVTDWNGDGTTGDVIPGSNIGSYMRGIKPGGLQSFIAGYNTNDAARSTPQTPAGQQLVAGGVFSQQELQQMGGVLQPLAATVPDLAGLGWLKTFDVRLGWVHKLGDRVEIVPSVSIFNLLNFANFDLPGNTQGGVLSFGAASLSPWATTLQPQNTVGGTSSSGVFGRINRASLQSGMSAAGTPRSVEWGLKVSF